MVSLDLVQKKYIGRWSLVIHSSEPTQTIASFILVHTKSSIFPVQYVVILDKKSEIMLLYLFLYISPSP